MGDQETATGPQARRNIVLENEQDLGARVCDVCGSPLPPGVDVHAEDDGNATTLGEYLESQGIH